MAGTRFVTVGGVLETSRVLEKDEWAKYYDEMLEMPVFLLANGERSLNWTLCPALIRTEIYLCVCVWACLNHEKLDRQILYIANFSSNDFLNNA